MKITKSQLKQMVKEEISNVTSEAMYGAGETGKRKIGMQDVAGNYLRDQKRGEEPYAPDIQRVWESALEDEIEKAPTAGFEKWSDDYRYYLFSKRTVINEFKHIMEKWGKDYWVSRAKQALETGESIFPEASESRGGPPNMDEDGWPRVPEDANPVPDSVYKPGEFPTEQRYKFVPPAGGFEGREAGPAPEEEYDLSAFQESMIKRIMEEELKKALGKKK